MTRTRTAAATLLLAACGAAAAQAAAPARLRAAREIDLAAEVGGRVVARPVPRNRRVGAGEVVLRIDRTFHEIAVARAEAELARTRAEEELAASELERSERLARTESIQASELDQVRARHRAAQAARQVAEAALQEARERLARTEVRAPVAGLLSELHPEVGESVAAGTVVARLLAVDALVAETWLTARQVTRVEKGDRLLVRIVEPAGPAIEGVVSEVAQGADMSRTFRLVVDLPEPPASLRAGFGARIVLGPKER